MVYLIAVDEGTMERKRSHLLIIIFVTITSVMILYGGFKFGGDVNEILTESMQQTVQQAALQEQQSIDDIVAGKIRNIEMISKTMTIIGDNEPLILEYLNTSKDSYQFDNLLIVGTDGVGIDADNKYVDIYGSLFFETAINGTLDVTDPYISYYTGNRVVAVSAPVYRGDDIAGVLVATYTTEYLTQLLLEQTNSMGTSAIVDGDGNIITSTDQNIAEFKEIDNLEFLYTTSLDQLRSDVLNGVEWLISFDYNNGGHITVYMPIAVNDWMLLFNAPKDSIVQAEQTIFSSMMYFIMFLTLFFLIFLLYVLRTRRKHLKQIETAAYYDSLTGLPNTLKLKIDIAKALKDNPKNRYVIAKFDFENFKVINELFDFEVGNKVLRAVAETSTHALEPSFLFARVGSDEFIMFAANGFLEDLNAIKIEYEARFKSLLPELEKHSLSFRYGRYFIKDGECDVDEIVNKVTIAHSFAKANKKLDICDYDDALKKQMVKIADITNKKDDALKNEEFKVFLQPKYRLNGHEMIGAEALVRWIEADGTMVYPNDFIPLFEQTGFIVELDKYMFTKVCCAIREWLDSVKQGVKISVNFSRINLTNPNFVAELADIASRYNVPSKYIEIEFTETTITENETNIIKVIDELHYNGFSVSIDDFGAGYSSLGMLKNFTVDTLKLDRSFFLNNDNDRGNLVIGGIIKLAQNLEMSVVAEGIEESEQADFLREINCEYAQGYYFAKPMSLDDFAEVYIKKTGDSIAGNDKI